MVISTLGSQYELQDDAKCDIFGAIWRILGASSSAQRVFGEATGFSLILTTLHGFKGDKGPSLTVCMKVFTYLLHVITAAASNNVANRVKLHSVISSQSFYDILSESGLICVECEKQVMHLLFELALEIVIPPSFTPETTEPSDDIGNVSIFQIITPSALFLSDKQKIYNAGALRVLIRVLLHFTSKLQLEFLKLIEELSRAGSFNQESLTSAGCVELLIETIYPLLSGSSPLLSHALRIIEVLGAYRLSSAELRVIIRYILQVRQMKSGQALVDMMERFTALDNIPLAPFVELDMSKSGHSSVQLVGNVFNKVATNYDIMNDFMSGGLHRLWKERLVLKLSPFPGMKHLDVAGGTGDVAFRILETIKSVNRRAVDDTLEDDLQEETQIYVCDINPNMLNVGRKRAQERGLEDLGSLVWVEGDAEKLIFEDGSMDGYTIAFGIRNVTHIEKVLAEAYRVLKKGGRFLCLELSHVDTPVFKQLLTRSLVLLKVWQLCMPPQV